MRKNRQLMTRPPLTRIGRIIKHLRNGDGSDRKRLAEEIEVSERTIQRDITHMRDQMSVPVEYDRRKRAYYL
jgi:predicted DNA-binding transcriptional regulator YafY